MVPADQGPIAVFCDPARREDPAQRVGLERLGHEVGDRHRQDPQDRRPSCRPRPRNERAELQAGQRVAERRRLDVRRRGRGQLGQEAAERSDEAVEVGIARRVVARPGPQAVGGPGDVVVQGDRRAVRCRGEDPDLRRDKGQAVRSQVQVADDRRLEPTDRVGHGRDADAGLQLDRIGNSTDPLAPLEDEGRQAGPGQVGRRDQAVVAAADRRSRPRSAGRAAGGGWWPRCAATVRPPSGRSSAGLPSPRSGRWRP